MSETNTLNEAVTLYACGAQVVADATALQRKHMTEHGAEESRLGGIAGVAVTLRAMASERGWVKRSTAGEKEYAIAAWVRDCGISKSAAGVLWNASLRVALHRDWADIETPGAQSAVFDALEITSQAGLLRLIKPKSEVVRGILVGLANAAIRAGFSVVDAAEMIDNAPMGDYDKHVVRQARKDARAAVAKAHAKKGGHEYVLQ